MKNQAIMDWKLKQKEKLDDFFEKTAIKEAPPVNEEKLKELAVIDKASINLDDIPRNHPIFPFLLDRAVDAYGEVDILCLITVFATLRIQHLFNFFLEEDDEEDSVFTEPNIFFGAVGDSETGKTRRIHKHVIAKARQDSSQLISMVVSRLSSGREDLFGLSRKDILTKIAIDSQATPNVLFSSLSALQPLEINEKNIHSIFSNLEAAISIPVKPGSVEALNAFLTMFQGVCFFYGDLGSLPAGTPSYRAFIAHLEAFDSDSGYSYKNAFSFAREGNALNSIFCAVPEAVSDLVDEGKKSFGILQRYIFATTERRPSDWVRPPKVDVGKKENKDRLSFCVKKINEYLLKHLFSPEFASKNPEKQLVFIPDELREKFEAECTSIIKRYKEVFSIKELQGSRFKRSAYCFLVLLCAVRCIVNEDPFFTVTEEEIVFATKISFLVVKHSVKAMELINLKRKTPKSFYVSKEIVKAFVEAYYLRSSPKGRRRALSNSTVKYLSTKKAREAMGLHLLLGDKLINERYSDTLESIRLSLAEDGYVDESKRNFELTEETYKEFVVRFGADNVNPF